jgi:biofilm PGA synthesis N-glycosyltransferase PgaC
VRHRPPCPTKGFYIRARRYAYALGRRWWRLAQSEVGRVQVLTGAAYIFRTEAIQAVGGFPSVGISADMDATWTLHRAGYRLAYVGRAVAFTVDPETFQAYRAQMRRWAAGFYQTMAKHRRQLWHPRAILVVGSGLFDLLALPITYGLIGWHLLTSPQHVRWYWAYAAVHLLVNTILVATVVGVREALLGAIPYTLVNFYNKGLYLWTFVREWILGCHYASWTGRHGRATVITPLRPKRAATLTMGMLAIALISFVITTW